MQTFITDKDFYKSASNLTRQHLQAQIYEGIHILASLLDVNDKLVNPKRSVKNHPASKLWVGYETELLYYIYCHISEWIDKRGCESKINSLNFILLRKYININWENQNPSWITDELIQTHRSVLIQKEIEKENNIEYKIKMLWHDEDFTYSQIQTEAHILNQKISYHYRKLWPDTPTNLKMRYDWRNK